MPLITAAGATQMAIDQWLLEQHLLGLQPPSLRFYTWSPPAISLGYHQRRWPLVWEQMLWQGITIDLIRRPTGGRAVLHQGDLTYAIAVSGITGNRRQVYQTLCEFLIQGWQALGLPLHYGQSGQGYHHQANCFSTATAADLVTSTGFKFIGSAQLYRGGAILQHGSIQLAPDLALRSQVFGDSGHPEQSPPDLQGLEISTILEALTTAAGDCFGVNWQVQPLTDLEWAAIRQAPALKLGQQSDLRSRGAP
ncbi:lipoate--protein ligase family protein [Neosynechococcus sphagnicola]|uniref:lipoate--protein ligase family protein n=1 Tax=Neosynechococcus sphagnicola TaxID=1501145 RepID=UPI000AAC3636|nr:biotin/lipoate A/B protein ligase family protein [Neosynechococcus sphagnicola]